MLMINFWLIDDFFCIIVFFFTYNELAWAGIKDTKELIKGKARAEGICLTKAEIIKDFKGADIDGRQLL